MNAAVFLDKDGTLIDDVPYNVDPLRMQLAAGAEEGVSLLHAAGFELLVISNQSGVARGYFPARAVERVADRLTEMLAAIGVPLLGFYYCPHHPEGVVPAYAVACSCRKPQPGMILRAASEHGIDTSRSWVVGDILDDVEAGHRAGCHAVLVDKGNETEWVLNELRRPDHVVEDLAQAARVILAAAGSTESAPSTGSQDGLPLTPSESRFSGYRKAGRS